MQASDIMSKKVVSVTLDTRLSEVARILIANSISAVPVLDDKGDVVGMVSEGDLVCRDNTDREARREWWLEMLAEGEPLSRDFLTSIGDQNRTARDVMTAPVVIVSETAAPREIAKLLAENHIKRVPVIRDGHVVGIVSRADLLRAFANEEAPVAAPQHGKSAFLAGLEGAISKLDKHFVEDETGPATEGPKKEQPAGAARPSAKDFKSLVAEFAHHKAERKEEERGVAAEQRRQTVKELLDHHIGDDGWGSILRNARAAAQRGEKEFILLNFPAGLCSDAGRAINLPEENWWKTLRGEAADIYLRYERELKPQGFHLAARVLDFPGGMPGNIGLFLVWGE